MCAYSKRVKSELEKFKTNELIVARTLYVDSFMFMPEMTFFRFWNGWYLKGNLSELPRVFTANRKTPALELLLPMRKIL